MANFELDAVQEAKVNAVAGSVLAKLFKGAAITFGATGTGVKTVTGYTASGLRMAANGVEKGGNFCGDFLITKGQEYDDKAKEMAEAAELCEAIAKKLAEEEVEVVA